MDILLKILDDSTEYFSKRVTLPCLIGRSKKSTVSIVHPLVSRQHCEIYNENNIIKVRDLASLNGTFYQKKRISRGVPVPVGDFFMIGNLRLVIQEVYGGTTKFFQKNASDLADMPTIQEDRFDSIEAIAPIPSSPSQNEINENDDIIDLANLGFQLDDEDEKSPF